MATPFRSFETFLRRCFLWQSNVNLVLFFLFFFFCLFSKSWRKSAKRNERGWTADTTTCWASLPPARTWKRPRWRMAFWKELRCDSKDTLCVTELVSMLPSPQLPLTSNTCFRLTGWSSSLLLMVFHISCSTIKTQRLQNQVRAWRVMSINAVNVWTNSINVSLQFKSNCTTIKAVNVWTRYWGGLKILAAGHRWENSVTA